MNEATLCRKSFRYDSETGAFTRLVSAGNKKAGSHVGYYTTKGYLRVWFNGRHVPLHRLAFLYMTGEIPDTPIDHINGVKTDNRWCNLRVSSDKANSSNRTKANFTNRLGVLGVHACHCGYRASYQGRHLGVFPTEQAASDAYQAAKRQFFSNEAA